MSAIRIKRSAMRLAAIGAIVAALALSSTAAAAPAGMGFYECGPVECSSGQYASRAAERADAAYPLGIGFTP